MVGVKLGSKAEVGTRLLCGRWFLILKKKCCASINYFISPCPQKDVCLHKYWWRWVVAATTLITTATTPYLGVVGVGLVVVGVGVVVRNESVTRKRVIFKTL